MRFVVVIILMFLCLQKVMADGYGLYMPDDYSLDTDSNEKILFIMDFSNSMREKLYETPKVDLMKNTMAKLMSEINPDTVLGLRIYGHKSGFSPVDACRASALAVPLGKNNPRIITNALFQINPKGMTPITYSLKQAVQRDFIGIKGKKRIILLTDGGENCDISPCEYVMQLIKIRKDISIDVIAFNVNDEDDLAQLRCTALVTSGKFYTANTAAELVKSLGSSINAKKNVEAKIITNH